MKQGGGEVGGDHLLGCRSPLVEKRVETHIRARIEIGLAGCRSPLVEKRVETRSGRRCDDRCRVAEVPS